ncbi:MAG: protein translocase subunit SecF [Gammaproteobacteria bacterium]
MKPEVNFMGRRHVAMIFSAVLILVCLLSLALQSLRFGLDFTSGHAVRVQFDQAVTTETATEVLRAQGYDDVRVAAFGSDRELRIVLPNVSLTGALDSLETGEAIRETLQQALNTNATLLASDFVSARAGADLVEKSGLGVLVALGMVTAYISARFQFKFAIAALVALAHDVVLTVGFFSIFRLQFDFTVLAAIMAVIGYSLNDTIIVADRIRENFRKVRQLAPLPLINLSINQTLSRTLITSGTTLLVVLTLLFVGGEAIQGFAVAMTVGIIVGTYSSIYVASALLLTLKVSRLDLVPAPLESDGRP